MSAKENCSQSAVQATTRQQTASSSVARRPSVRHADAHAGVWAGQRRRGGGRAFPGGPVCTDRLASGRAHQGPAGLGTPQRTRWACSALTFLPAAFSWYAPAQRMAATAVVACARTSRGRGLIMQISRLSGLSLLFRDAPAARIPDLPFSLYSSYNPSVPRLSVC